jgi:hypothetical protein
MITVGKHIGRARAWNLGEAKTGNEELSVDMTIKSGECAGQSITARLYFTEKTFDRSIESMRYMGWKGDDLSNIQGLDSNDVEIVVEHEEYEGQTRARVKWINRIGGAAAAKPLEASKAKSFAERMKARVARADQERSAKAAANGEFTKPDTSDVPF